MEKNKETEEKETKGKEIIKQLREIHQTDIKNRYRLKNEKICLVFFVNSNYKYSNYSSKIIILDEYPRYLDLYCDTRMVLIKNRPENGDYSKYNHTTIGYHVWLSKYVDFDSINLDNESKIKEYESEVKGHAENLLQIYTTEIKVDRYKCQDENYIKSVYTIGIDEEVLEWFYSNKKLRNVD